MRKKKIQAIETIYNGYRFRSRLEARWAVFFDALGINYEYEKEGYSLEGKNYLPDFYLPHIDAFIEIKGEPELDEDGPSKSELLTIYTGKPVHVLVGPIWYPASTDYRHDSHYYPPSIYKYSFQKGFENEATKKIDAAPDLIGLLSRVDDHFLKIDLDEDNEIVVAHTNPIDELPKMNTLDMYLYIIEQQKLFLEVFRDSIQGREDEIREILDVENGWGLKIFEYNRDGYGLWHECLFCGRIGIGGIDRHNPFHDQYSRETPRLLAAYAKARQARFEHGETP